jgi:hypothetical protein
VVQEVQQRSTFVTVLAWIFIALSGLGTLISILQNIMAWTVFRSAEFDQAMQASPQVDTPFVIDFMFSHFYLFFLAGLLISVFTLASSIGLLKRKNWARLSFIGIMALAILWNLGCLVIQCSTLNDLFNAPLTGQGGADFRIIVVSVTIIGAIFSVGFIALFGWIAKRLTSSAIVAEFRGAA